MLTKYSALPKKKKKKKLLRLKTALVTWKQVSMFPRTTSLGGPGAQLCPGTGVHSRLWDGLDYETGSLLATQDLTSEFTCSWFHTSDSRDWKHKGQNSLGFSALRWPLLSSLVLHFKRIELLWLSTVWIIPLNNNRNTKPKNIGETSMS